MEYLKLWKNQLDKLKECTALEKGLILEACIDYQEGRDVTFPENADGRFLRLVWADFREMLDANSRKQEASRINGGKGGRPAEAREDEAAGAEEPGENPAITQEKPSHNPAITQAEPKNPKKQETGYTKQDEGNGASHTEEGPTPSMDARAREGSYLGPDGKEHPCRYDKAWMLSARARGAVAMRVAAFVQERLTVNTGGDLYGYLLDALKSGVPPEWIEDAALRCDTTARLLAMLTAMAAGRAVRKEAG
ncbi:MAG: hypothetical protein K5919_05135 [Clostridiales bacterium]|nr:hypothetical protein [Clostridiales bacterium]